MKRYGIFVFSSNSMSQTFKSSDGGQRKWAKESNLVNWNNAIYIDEAALYGGDFSHKNG